MAFQRLKELLCSVAILRDFTKPFILQTDASDRGIGAVLRQEDPEGKNTPVPTLAISCCDGRSVIQRWRRNTSPSSWAFRHFVST